MRKLMGWGVALLGAALLLGSQAHAQKIERTGRVVTRGSGYTVYGAPNAARRGPVTFRGAGVTVTGVPDNSLPFSTNPLARMAAEQVRSAQALARQKLTSTVRRSEQIRSMQRFQKGLKKYRQFNLVPPTGGLGSTEALKSLR